MPRDLILTARNGKRKTAIFMKQQIQILRTYSQKKGPKHIMFCHYTKTRANLATKSAHAET